MGSLTKKKKKQKKKTIFGGFIFTPWNHRIFLTKLKLFNSVLLLMSDHIQGNTVEKDFQIWIKSNFTNTYTIV